MNFLCISNYNNDLDWVSEYPNPHLIYDKTWIGGVIDNDNSSLIAPTNLKEKRINNWIKMIDNYFTQVLFKQVQNGQV